MENIKTVETGIPAGLLKHARELRKNLTDAEKLLWQILRNRKLNNWKFRRQHPIAEGFIVDFYCVETRVAIELDGAYHKEEIQQEMDKNRTDEIKKYGIRLIRFWNEAVLNETESVLKRIITFSSSPPTPSPNWRGGESSPEAGNCGALLI